MPRAHAATALPTSAAQPPPTAAPTPARPSAARSRPRRHRAPARLALPTRSLGARQTATAAAAARAGRAPGRRPAMCMAPASHRECCVCAESRMGGPGRPCSVHHSLYLASGLAPAAPRQCAHRCRITFARRRCGSDGSACTSPGDCCTTTPAFICQRDLQSSASGVCKTVRAAARAAGALGAAGPWPVKSRRLARSNAAVAP